MIFHKKIDNIEILASSNFNEIGIHLNNPTVDDIEDALDSCFKNGYTKVLLHGKIAKKVFDEYSCFEDLDQPKVIFKKENLIKVNFDYNHSKNNKNKSKGKLLFFPKIGA